METGEEQDLYYTAKGEITALLSSHDGTRLTFSTKRDDPSSITSTVNVVSVTGGVPQRLFVHESALVWPIVTFTEEAAFVWTGPGELDYAPRNAET